jgi:adenylate kinase
MQNKFIVFLGLPGSGKGTQSKILTEGFDNFHSLSTGDMIRKILKEDNELSRKLNEIYSAGLLIDDQTICQIVEKEITFWDQNSNVKKNVIQNFILDGFPRSLNQAENLNEFLANSNIGNVALIVLFDIKKRIAIKRLLDRLICKDCGNIQSTFSLKKHETNSLSCNKCGGEMIKRKDDQIKIIRTRIKNDKKIIDFLLKFYQNKKIKCLKLNAALKVNVLHKKIKNIIDLL